MSIHVMSWVFKHSEAKLGARLALLVLADHAKDDGTNTYPSLATIAAEARLSRNGARECLKRLEEDGSIVADGVADKGQVRWRVIMADEGVQNLEPPSSSLAEGGQAAWPEPSIEPSSSVGARASAVTIGGKRVPQVLVTRAEYALSVYGEGTGRKLRPYTAAGKPSEALKRILSRLVEYPDTDEAALTQIVRNALVNPPSWVEGQVQVGDIFGPKAFERALVNDGRPQRSGTDPAKQERIDRFGKAYEELTGRTL